MSTQAPPHAVSPESQATEHVLDAQSGLPSAGAGHVFPQPPQLSGSRVTSTHEPEHAFSVPGQELPQPVGVQTWFTLQATPQPPQFCGSVFVLTHSPLQFEKPVSHAASQRPALQAAAPWFGVPHVLPQAPQLFGSFVKSTQTGPHRSSPFEHTKSQTPDTQSGVPPDGAVHTASQESQWFASFFRSTQRPEQTVSPSPHATGASGPESVPPLAPLASFPAAPPEPFGKSPGRTQMFVFVSHTHPSRHSWCAPHCRPL